MELLLCADDRYAPYAATTMVSALEHLAEPEKARVTLLTPGLSEETQRSLARLAQSYGARAQVVEIRDADVDPSCLHRFGIASILPLFMHEHLGHECKRAIYLDCDMVVLADLSPIWRLPLGGAVLAAVRDVSGDPEEHDAIVSSPYFNSGLLVVDLERWRQSDVAGQALDFLQQQGQRLRYPDQDALNHVLAGQWHELEPKWNLQSSAYAALNTRPAHLRPLLPALEDALRDPSVVHYTGHVKPWHAHSEHPLKDIFRHFSCLTPWPLREKELMRGLHWRKRLRMMLKANKIRRRRNKTRWTAHTGLRKANLKS
ncbi:glycosyltransferase family 8 protein [Halomonas sp. A29]|uniref:glycosyltransferase family 8 protein n=1 Tax=Halomonas sp. A29 TaxID=3102786 RepID=UPI00398ABF1C